MISLLETQENNTPLDLALANGHTQVANALREAGAKKYSEIKGLVHPD